MNSVCQSNDVLMKGYLSSGGRTVHNMTRLVLPLSIPVQVAQSSHTGESEGDGQWVVAGLPPPALSRGGLLDKRGGLTILRLHRLPVLTCR